MANCNYDARGYDSAYSALSYGYAGSEGIALAYTELCRQLGIDCTVVYGQLDWADHCWNVIKLDGDYYHVDVTACIDGGIRDTHQILEADFPIFYKYRISNGSLGRCLITHYQVPILIGKALIRPGDVILGDIDGVLVVPRDIAYDVLIRAEEIKSNEKKIFGWVKEGQSIQQITEKGGYF